MLMANVDEGAAIASQIQGSAITSKDSAVQ
jgi:hypothetical protein